MSENTNDKFLFKWTICALRDTCLLQLYNHRWCSFHRLSELRDVLVDVRAKQESELNERRTLEQQMSKKWVKSQILFFNESCFNLFGIVHVQWTSELTLTKILMFCLSQNLWITTSIKWSQQAQGWGYAHDGHHTAGEGPRQSSGQAQSDIQSCWHCGGCQQKAPL